MKNNCKMQLSSTYGKVGDKHIEEEMIQMDNKEIEQRIYELQQQLKECSNDWAFWDIQRELTYWKMKH